MDLFITFVSLLAIAVYACYSLHVAKQGKERRKAQAHWLEIAVADGMVIISECIRIGKDKNKAVEMAIHHIKISGAAQGIKVDQSFITDHRLATRFTARYNSLVGIKHGKE